MVVRATAGVFNERSYFYRFLIPGRDRMTQAWGKSLPEARTRVHEMTSEKVEFDDSYAEKWIRGEAPDSPPVRPSDPLCLEDYDLQYRRNTRTEGVGLQVWIHLPCPFCAAVDFWVCRAVDLATAVAGSKTCSNCLRACRGVYLTDGTDGVVQTGGNDPPSWWSPRVCRGDP